MRELKIRKLGNLEKECSNWNTVWKPILFTVLMMGLIIAIEVAIFKK